MKSHRVYVDLLNRYVSFEGDYRMTTFHVFMMWTCSKILEQSKPFRRLGGKVELVAIKDFTQDNRLPDIYTPFFDVECETGLKYHYDDLIRRILGTQKTVIVVLPNPRVKERYLANISVRKTHLKICTLGEFSNVVLSILKNIHS